MERGMSTKIGPVCRSASPAKLASFRPMFSGVRWAIFVDTSTPAFALSPCLAASPFPTVVTEPKFPVEQRPAPAVARGDPVRLLRRWRLSKAQPERAIPAVEALPARLHGSSGENGLDAGPRSGRMARSPVERSSEKRQPEPTEGSALCSRVSIWEAGACSSVNDAGRTAPVERASVRQNRCACVQTERRGTLRPLWSLHPTASAVVCS